MLKVGEKNMFFRTEGKYMFKYQRSQSSYKFKLNSYKLFIFKQMTSEGVNIQNLHAAAMLH